MNTKMSARPYGAANQEGIDRLVGFLAGQGGSAPLYEVFAANIGAACVRFAEEKGLITVEDTDDTGGMIVLLTDKGKPFDSDLAAVADGWVDEGTALPHQLAARNDHANTGLGSRVAAVAAECGVGSYEHHYAAYTAVSESGGRVSDYDIHCEAEAYGLDRAPAEDEDDGTPTAEEMRREYEMEVEAQEAVEGVSEVWQF